MKKIVRWILLLLLNNFIYTYTDALTIHFASDTHSHLAPISERSSDLKGSIGDIALAATLIGKTRLTDPNSNIGVFRLQIIGSYDKPMSLSNILLRGSNPEARTVTKAVEKLITMEEEPRGLIFSFAN